MGAPLFCGEETQNTVEEHTFKGKLVFGSSALASHFSGKPALTWTRTDAGKYTVSLPCTYRAFTGSRFSARSATATAVLFGVPTDVSTNLQAASPSITVEFRTAAGVCTDPTSGDEITYELSFSNSTLNATVA